MDRMDYLGCDKIFLLHGSGLSSLFSFRNQQYKRKRKGNLESRSMKILPLRFTNVWHVCMVC